jgi:hypothetical protein
MLEFGKSETLVRASAITAAAAVGTLLLGACGQQTPPSPNQVKSSIQYFQLDNIKTPKGEPVKCIMYGDGSSRTQDSHSWFSMVCDFEGVAQFPPDAFPQTPTPTPTPTSEKLPTPPHP